VHWSAAMVVLLWYVYMVCFVLVLEIVHRVTILLSDFMYLIIVNKISSPSRYADYVIQLLFELSTT